MKAPAFQFYPDQWLSSQRVQMMTLEEEGAYIRLLGFCWQHGSIPADPEQAARLIGKGASTTLATVVLAMFVAGDPGRLVHDRLERERVKQAVWREKSAAGGRKSGEMRKGGSRVVRPPYEPKGNIPSPSPSPSPIPISGSKDIHTDAPAKPSRVFVIPLADEVETYSKEIGYPMNGQAWCDSYAQKGWLVGKSKMKDWKAAVRNWKANGWQPNGNGTDQRARLGENIRQTASTAADHAAHPWGTPC